MAATKVGSAGIVSGAHRHDYFSDYLVDHWIRVIRGSHFAVNAEKNVIVLVKKPNGEKGKCENP